MQLPSDFDILALPSVPGRRRQAQFSGSMISGMTSVWPYTELNLCTISRVCSIIGSWSSPTGTVVARNAVMSGGLRYGIGKEAYRCSGTLLRLLLRAVVRESAQLYLGLDRRVTLQTLYRNQIHVVESQFAQLRHLRLYEDRRTLGVDAARKVVERDLDDVLAHLVRIVGVVRERLCVGDHDEYLLVESRLLQLDASRQRSDEVSQMKFARRAVARKV